MQADNGLVLIDSDSHVRESPELWVERLPAAFRDRAPRFSPEEAPPGATDSTFRIPEMEQDGVFATVLYTSKGMNMFHMEDAALQEACFRVYNDWLTEYCSVAPDRLYGIGLISAYNIDNALKELEHCRKAGMAGAMVWMTPPPSLPFSRADHYDRLWAAAQEMDIPINLHVNTGFDHISLYGGSDPRSSSRAADPDTTPEQAQREGMWEYCHAAVNERTENVSNALLELIFAGVLDRYPRLRLVLAETEIGWLPFLSAAVGLQHEALRREAAHPASRIAAQRILRPPGLRDIPGRPGRLSEFQLVGRRDTQLHVVHRLPPLENSLAAFS
jgi:predicted TIM-barrel fold metal-dependent hydrolase